MCLDQYFEIIEEESKTHSLEGNGTKNYAYCYGILKTHLEWALAGDAQKEVVLKNISDTIAGHTKQMELPI
jgi:hypothetical protein